LPKYIYDQLGNSVGYINANYIHTLHGQAVGQINGTDVHKMNGEYVGKLHDNMVVDTKVREPERIGHRGDPGNAGFYGIPKNRGAVESDYPVVFSKLLERVSYIDDSVNKFKQKLI
jgi:hypothetical protein